MEAFYEYDANGKLTQVTDTTGKSHRIGILGAEKVRPILGRVLDDVLVHLEGDHAVIIAIPVALGILGVIGNRRHAIGARYDGG